MTTFLNSSEAVIIHADTKLSYALNSTGIAIWNLLKEDCTVEEIANQICDEFDVSLEHAREGVMRFIEAMESFRLIKCIKQEKR